MAADIARTTSLPFIPKIIPFADGRAVFFCSNPSEATTVISIGIIKTQGIVVHLSKWNEKIDIIDPTTARFEGWIGIKGLPFNMWTKGIFEKISKWCGGLLEIDQQTMEYSNLAAAKIKVQANRVTDIPQTTFQKFEAQWLTLQVIPLFATHITTSNNDPPQQNTITDNPQAQRAIPIPNKQGQRVCQLNHNQKRSEQRTSSSNRPLYHQQRRKNDNPKKTQYISSWSESERGQMGPKRFESEGRRRTQQQVVTSPTNARIFSQPR